jgi:hypothetical protein
MAHHYRVFGLSVASDLPCPELLPGPTADADITFRYGDVPEWLDNPADSGARWQTAPGLYLLNLPRLARFLVRDGREVLIMPRPEVSEDRLRTFLLSACLSILLHQRKLFALHCSAVQMSGGAVLFSGNSGMGKSTLAGAFLERGCKLLADDMLALTFDDGDQLIVLPGFPQVKLWADSARALGRSTDGLRRVMPEYERFIAAEPDRFDPRPAPLRAIYFLRTHNQAGFLLEPLEHTPRFNALLDNTWQKLTLPGLGLREWHFQMAARVAARAYAARITRPQEPLEIAHAVRLIENDLKSDAADR